MHRSYSRSHLTNAALRQTLLDRAARDCENTAELLADIAEFDERKLYREEGYDSTCWRNATPSRPRRRRSNRSSFPHLQKGSPSSNELRRSNMPRGK